jgi:hypothetical protein
MTTCQHSKIKSVSVDGLELIECLTPGCGHKWRTDHNPLEDNCLENLANLAKARGKTPTLPPSNTTLNANGFETLATTSIASASDENDQPVPTVREPAIASEVLQVDQLPTSSE